MPTPSYHIICTKKELIAPNVYELRFEKPAGLIFKAGQFVLFNVPLIEYPADMQTRALSIASAPDETDLLFVVKMKEGGRMSRWVEEILKEGMSVRIQGPFGLFTLKPGDTNACIFVATGAGVAPFRSHLLWALEKDKQTRVMHLIFGVRQPGDFFWLQELQSLEASYENFSFHTTVTEPDPSWNGHVGRVQSVLQTLVQDPEKVSMYICGAPEMVKDTKTLCLGDLKMPKAHVHGEGYI